MFRSKGYSKLGDRSQYQKDYDLFKAVASNNQDDINETLAAGANPAGNILTGIEPIIHTTAFNEAFLSNKLTLMRQLFHSHKRFQKINLEEPYSESKNTYLLEATERNWHGAMEVLLELGSSLNARNIHGNTALHLAVIHKDPAGLDILLLHFKLRKIRKKKLKDPGMIKNKDGFTPRQLAEHMGQKNMLAIFKRYEIPDRPASNSEESVMKTIRRHLRC